MLARHAYGALLAAFPNSSLDARRRAKPSNRAPIPIAVGKPLDGSKTAGRLSRRPVLQHGGDSSRTVADRVGPLAAVSDNDPKWTKATVNGSSFVLEFCSKL